MAHEEGFGSLELVSPSRLPQFNKQTGRPIRRGAGTKNHQKGYVDSSMIDVDGADDSLSEDEDGNPVQAKRVKKRKRTPSPTPPPLEPIIYDEEADEPSDEESVITRRRDRVPAPVTLQFNVPLGFHGPLVVKLDKDIIDRYSGNPQSLRPPEKMRILETSSTTESSSRETSPAGKGYRGFTDLPPELRNKIYRMIFVSECPLEFSKPNNFCKSAALLSTCKLVASEGPSILYGENKFSFERNRHTRSPFWDPTPKEIGYKDVRQFLKMIGPENVQYLRDIKFVFEDANPGATPYLSTHEERRFLNDEHLIDCLRILRNAPLRTLRMMFLGRRTILRQDAKFLGYLEQIKADEVLHEMPRWYHAHKIHPWLFNELQKVMQREKKLYTPIEETTADEMMESFQ